MDSFISSVLRKASFLICDAFSLASLKRFSSSSSF